ncbi:hypothetical protein B9Z65_3771 [Elsinoe australis]|uniref:Uncharacterized protein n=1 Tax=Elsinoe australis TaxID=40998 RepID=A0A2P8AG63_9PEZI|nr:hypothetical protein B9Z65_3771 [Elsinoe australis]
MFILAVPPRPLLPAETLSQTQYLFRFPSQPPFSTITLALNPGTTIPPDLAAAIYYSLPSSPDSFRFLGYLGQGRDSGTYRIISAEVNPSTALAPDSEGDMLLDDSAAPSSNGGEVRIGISIEPAGQVAEQVARFKAEQAARGGAGAGAMVKANGGAGGVGKVETKVLAQRIIGNAFNFLSSFGSEQIPLKAFQEWWKKFEGKVERDPSFLEREQD